MKLSKLIESIERALVEDKNENLKMLDKAQDDFEALKYKDVKAHVALFKKIMKGADRQMKTDVEYTDELIADEEIEKGMGHGELVSELTNLAQDVAKMDDMTPERAYQMYLGTLLYYMINHSK